MYRTILFLSGCCLLLPQYAASDEDRVTIGLMAELTGQFARLGEDCRRGYQLAQKLSVSQDGPDGLRLRFVLGDSQGLAKPGLSEFRRLIDIERAVAVVTTRSPVGLAINPISREKGVPVVGIVGHPSFIEQNELAFRIWPSAAAEGSALADRAGESGTVRAAAVTLEDDYFLAIAGGFSRRLKELGGRTVISENVLPEEHDFSTLIQKLLRRGPDSVLVNVGPAQAGTFVRKLRANGYTGNVFSNFLMGTPDALRMAGDSAEGVVFVEVNFDKPNFMSEMKKEFKGHRSSPIGYSCFVGLSAVIQAIQSAPSASGPRQAAEALRRLGEVAVPDGYVKMVGREAQLGLRYRSIENGRVSNASSIQSRIPSQK